MILDDVDYSNKSPDPQNMEPTNASGDMREDLCQDELRRRVSRLRTDHSNGLPIQYPELASGDELDKWTSKLEIALQTSGIPPHQWSDAAIIFTAGSGRVNMEMRVRREARQNMGIKCWPWDEFKRDLKEVLITFESEPSRLQQLSQEHPVAANVAKVAVGTGLVVAGTTVLAPAVVVGGLNSIGFTAGGVAGGSLAAGIQSLFYGGATTGLFSLCQSLGTAAVATSATTIATAAGTIAAGTSILRSGTTKGSPDDQADSNSSHESPPPYCRQD